MKQFKGSLFNTRYLKEKLYPQLLETESQQSITVIIVIVHLIFLIMITHYINFIEACFSRVSDSVFRCCCCCCFLMYILHIIYDIIYVYYIYIYIYKLCIYFLRGISKLLPITHISPNFRIYLTIFLAFLMPKDNTRRS